MQKPSARFMIDLETMGRTPGCAIASIGAVVFSPEDGIISTFYRRVELDSCVRLGLTLDADTVIWWMKQGDEARAELSRPGADSLGPVLHEFIEWAHPLMGVSKDCEVWANGPDFDLEILQAAFRAVQRQWPWPYWVGRCYRTLRHVLGEEAVKFPKGVKHHALDDARAQAEHVRSMLLRLERMKEAVPPAALETAVTPQ